MNWRARFNRIDRELRKLAEVEATRAAIERRIATERSMVDFLKRIAAGDVQAAAVPALPSTVRPLPPAMMRELRRLVGEREPALQAGGASAATDEPAPGDRGTVTN